MDLVILEAIDEVFESFEGFEGLWVYIGGKGYCSSL